MNYYSGEAIRQRQLARERAIAWKVIKATAKTFLVIGLASVFALVAAYHMLVWSIDGQIDQSNIRDCEDVKTVQLEAWQKLKSKCQQYYDTGEISYMRQYHAELDNQ